jgi:glucan phosphoethanolaminetransferase (alkaline phosphatase superfamily)
MPTKQYALFANAATTTTKESTPMIVIIGATIGTVVGALLIGLAIANIVYYKRKQLAKLTIKPIQTKSALASLPV